MEKKPANIRKRKQYNFPVNSKKDNQLKFLLTKYNYLFLVFIR